MEVGNDNVTQARSRFSPRVKKQLLILSLCRLSESFVLSSIVPYLYFMIKSFKVPEDDIAFLIGVMGAAFSCSQFLSSILWGRASDRFGRKPILLCGLVGFLVSFLVLAFAGSVWQVVMAKCMMGLLNGNVGIRKTYVGEIVPQKDLQPVAFSLIPLMWAVGSILGPLSGAYLSRPVNAHPGLWNPGGIFSTFPYALPNFLNCCLLATTAAMGFLLLEEPLDTSGNERDNKRRGLGKILISFLKSRRRDAVVDGVDESSPLIVPAPVHQDDEPAAPPPAMKNIFSYQSTLNIIVTALLCFHSAAFDNVIPVYLSYPKLVTDPQNPFRYFGGFGMHPAEIGSLYSAFGIFSMASQALIFPPVVRRYGALRCLQMSLLVFPVIHVVAPVGVVTPKEFHVPFVIMLFLLRYVAGLFVFPCLTIHLTNSVASVRVLGTVNGVVAAMSALGKSLGPMGSGMVFSYAQRIQYLILPFWLFALCSVLSIIPSFKLRDGKA